MSCEAGGHLQLVEGQAYAPSSRDGPVQVSFSPWSAPRAPVLCPVISQNKLALLYSPLEWSGIQLSCSAPLLFFFQKDAMLGLMSPARVL